MPLPPATTASTSPTAETKRALAELASLSLKEVLAELDREHAASLLEEATHKAIARNDSPTTLLDRLMRGQLRVRTEERARAAFKRSAIFPETSLDAFDLDAPKELDRELVDKAAELAFIEDKTNCVFPGSSGVGKTHLANAIGVLACLRGYCVHFVLAADLLNDLVAAQARTTLHRRLLAWGSPDLLIVDELATSPSTTAAPTCSTRCSTAGTSAPRPS